MTARATAGACLAALALAVAAFWLIGRSGRDDEPAREPPMRRGPQPVSSGQALPEPLGPRGTPRRIGEMARAGPLADLAAEYGLEPWPSTEIRRRLPWLARQLLEGTVDPQDLLGLSCGVIGLLAEGHVNPNAGIQPLATFMLLDEAGFGQVKLVLKMPAPPLEQDGLEVADATELAQPVTSLRIAAELDESPGSITGCVVDGVRKLLFDVHILCDETGRARALWSTAMPAIVRGDELRDALRSRAPIVTRAELMLGSEGAVWYAESLGVRLASNGREEWFTTTTPRRAIEGALGDARIPAMARFLAEAVRAAPLTYTPPEVVGNPLELLRGF